MIELTHKNFFQFGYNNKFFNQRSSSLDRWQVRYLSCDRIANDFKTECILTAKLIAQTTQKQISLFLSGGCDSEVVLQSFCLAEIPLVAKTVVFKNAINQHDVDYAIKTAKKWNVSHQFIELDIIDFWKNKIDQYADPTQCVSPQLLVMMWMMDQFPDQYPVMGSGDCLLRRDLETDTWFLVEKEKIASWYRYQILQKQEACLGFFQYTPEIMFSFLNDPLTLDAIQNCHINGYKSSNAFKYKLYQKYFSIEDRPKFTGFEKVMDLDAKYRNYLESKFPGSNSEFRTNYFDLLDSIGFKSNH